MRGLIVGLLSLVLAACASLPTTSPTPPSTPTLAATQSPSVSLATAAALATGSSAPVAGGCGNTQVLAGPGPDVALGLTDNPWALATPASAGIVAYFWYPPPDLIFAHGPNDGTKVLWVSHTQQAAHLTVAAHPLNGSAPVVQSDFPAADSPAGNYPSGIDLPSPGCWQLDLTLGSAQATLDVVVAPAQASVGKPQPAGLAAPPACDGVRLYCPGLVLREVLGARGQAPIIVPPGTMPPGVNSGQHDTPCPNDKPCGP
jgi:hypothetical protein